MNQYHLIKEKMLKVALTLPLFSYEKNKNMTEIFNGLKSF